jgi:hypothetical protein
MILIEYADFRTLVTEYIRRRRDEPVVRLEAVGKCAEATSEALADV